VAIALGHVRLRCSKSRQALGGFGVLLLCTAAMCFGPVSPAHAQGHYPAVVTHVVDGDTVDVHLVDGRNLTVRLIGINTPETVRPGTAVECGGPEASDYMRGLAEGRSVTLVSDPTQDAVDVYGRSLFYVDRTDGVDVGAEMLRAGWATVYVFERDFQRLPQYRDAENEAREDEAGVWSRCNGDFIALERMSCERSGARRRVCPPLLQAPLGPAFPFRLADAWTPPPSKVRLLSRLEGGIPPVARNPCPLLAGAAVWKPGSGSHLTALS
jgi:micrococcal nuclease